MKINYGLFVSLMKGDGILFTLLYCAATTYVASASQCVNTLWWANVAYITLTTNISLVVLQTLKQTKQNNKYGVWNLKLEIKIKLNMALLELIEYE